MIDFKREKELFETEMERINFPTIKNEYGNYKSDHVNGVFHGWIERAKLYQVEINKEREQATEYYVDAEYLKEEISQLKKQLSRYQKAEQLIEQKVTGSLRHALAIVDDI